MATAEKAKDGRQVRSERTRGAVAEAMLDCMEDGILRPSAKQVAEKAGVSTRAVFRHFDNMEALIEEAAEIQIERVMNQLPPVVTSGSLDQRIDSLVAYAAHCNETVAPVRRATLLSEPFSQVIQKRFAWSRGIERKLVRQTFASELNDLAEAARRDRIAALRALVSFSYWDELRRHEKLSLPAATRVLRDSIRSLLQ